MIKVNYFLNALGIGGTEKTAMLFAQNLSGDFQVETFTYADGDLTRKDQFDRVTLLERHSTDWSLLEDCDILHAFRSGYKERPEPGVDINVPHFIETNIFGHYDPNIRIDRSLFMSEWLMNYTLRRLAPISRSIMPRRFDFINNPVEEPFTDDTLSIAKQWKDEGAIILGRCGRPDPGIYHAINVKAAHLLRMQGYDVRFIVVAPPPNMLDDLVKWDIPFYTIEPTVEPLILSMFYNSIDIHAHARADGETCSVAIEESTIHKKPTITHIATPSVPGMGVFQAQTTLVEDGITGFVVQNDAAIYADALKRLIDDPELGKYMGIAAYKKAMKEYHVDVCQEKLERIYKEVVS
jgi:glycosyltransferase involved in cell wall biosynthesis